MEQNNTTNKMLYYFFKGASLACILYKSKTDRAPHKWLADAGEHK